MHNNAVITCPCPNCRKPLYVGATRVGIKAMCMDRRCAWWGWLESGRNDDRATRQPVQTERRD